ncbi:hypothetical protein CSPX01_04394 [Colletotrichum filicis]|nr:hypothetical protein CSPX01_04394 [Colletotrichum filicis]
MRRLRTRNLLFSPLPASCLLLWAPLSESILVTSPAAKRHSWIPPSLFVANILAARGSRLARWRFHVTLLSSLLAMSPPTQIPTRRTSTRRRDMRALRRTVLRLSVTGSLGSTPTA